MISAEKARELVKNIEEARLLSPTLRHKVRYIKRIANKAVKEATSNRHPYARIEYDGSLCAGDVRKIFEPLGYEVSVSNTTKYRNRFDPKGKVVTVFVLRW